MNDADRAADLLAHAGLHADGWEDLVALLGEAFVAVRADERARIVAYLRSPGARYSSLGWCATRIERGET